MILNFGSINLDLVYRVPHLPVAGETLASTSFDRFLGGKGINQSIAAAQAGGAVRHIGCLGPDGEWLRSQIAAFGVSLTEIVQTENPTGHAVIYVDDHAENQIVLFPGANHAFTMAQIDQALDRARPGDWVLLQNETNFIPQIAQGAQARGLRVAYSAAPFDPEAVRNLLGHIDLLALNEGEAAALEQELGQHPTHLSVDHVLITKGSRGAEFHSDGMVYRQGSFPVEAVDTTGAGDTFLGAFMARFATGEPRQALEFAAAAAALQVTRKGAATAIPSATETERFQRQLNAGNHAPQDG